ncbi:MAG TPA: 1-deoxy-D-xylulose-5-phosphate reductoisomerase [Candidatus Limnocylindrales bacterium]|nr:1-deoxy-D-xylulose-5-phosphate reductoisomerase [Candidatus Limnocylindrales bacterium]
MSPAGGAGPAGRTRVAVLGSTGSIGRQALEVLARLNDRFEVVALAAATNATALSGQIAAFHPRVAALADSSAAAALELPRDTALLAGNGQAGDPLAVLASRPDVDLVIVATGGLAALAAVLAALEAGKVVATANKETLVAGGHLVMPLAREQAAGGDPLERLRPIDSEHSAIWQCLAGEARGSIERLLLTASGGPFLHGPADLSTVIPAAALAHPTWQMGPKITIDSATLMNKGLEVIEAHWLYDVAYERIEVVVHPESLVHSAVAFVDGSLKAQLGLPDMRVPIQYALTHPDRASGAGPGPDLVSLGRFSFEPPDEGRFPALVLAREAGRRGPRASAALIAADEVAVERFLAGSLDFPGIVRLCAAAVGRFGGGPGEAMPDLDGLRELEAEVRAFCRVAPARAAV